MEVSFHRDHLDKLRYLASLPLYHSIRAYFKHILSDIHVSPDVVELLITPCMGHIEVKEGDDAIDGPHKSFKFQCDVCVQPYILDMNVETTQMKLDKEVNNLLAKFKQLYAVEEEEEHDFDIGVILCECFLDRTITIDYLLRILQEHHLNKYCTALLPFLSDYQKSKYNVY